uniref:RING-type domain-containing protein n=1 Tax=viral metagenome TaxID=1070528 RepID=A0A6C0I4H3_9ZZZZ
MTEHEGDCGVCATALPVGANHAYTTCKHLFCISCLLKWHKTNAKATCPMCRAPLYEDDANAQSVRQEAVQETAAQGTWMTLQEMDFNHDEQYMHNNMMFVVNAHAEHYCRNNPTCTYMGTNNLRTIRNQEYDRIEVGSQNPNCHYIIELRDSSRAFRYKFGRIEDIRMMHPMFQGFSWFVFRELIDRWDNDSGYMRTVWSHETQLISVQDGDVNTLRQYVPRIRMST